VLNQDSLFTRLPTNTKPLQVENTAGFIMFRPTYIPASIAQQKIINEINKRNRLAEEAAKAARPKVYHLVSPQHHDFSTTSIDPVNISIIDDDRNTTSHKPSSSELVIESINDQGSAGKDRPGVRFYAVGCQGSANAAQQSVAELMDMLAANPDMPPPDFILLLGDNVYDWGVGKPDDDMFEKYFYSIYSNPKYKHLKKIPFFIILGNHDENLHSLDVLVSERGVERGMHQVAHSYYPDAQYPKTKDKQNLYHSHTDEDHVALNLDKLPKWNMPSRAYSLACESTQIFCIDSNTFVSDYLNFCRGDVHPGNQVAWLLHEYPVAVKAGKKTILALHHPPVTPGKRAFHNDIHLYLSNEELTSQEFKTLFGELLQCKTLSYNALIKEILKQNNLVFDLVLAAHDHDVYYINNKERLQTNSVHEYPICQVTSGGGGGSLQKRESFDDQADMGCFLKRHAVTDVYCPARGPIEFRIHTLPKSKHDHAFQLHFDVNDPNPYRSYPEISTSEINAIKKFRVVVLNAVDKYFAFLAPHQAKENGKFLGNTPWSGNVSHGHSGVERAHIIWAYLNNEKADNYADTIKTVYMMSRWNSYITSPTEHSFINILNREIARNYNESVTMDVLYKEVISHELSVKSNMNLGKYS
jgi:hypothetical protein